jgi:hypothetical protein
MSLARLLLSRFLVPTLLTVAVFGPLVFGVLAGTTDLLSL